MDKRRSHFLAILLDLDETLVGFEDAYHYFDGIIQKVIKNEFKLDVPSQEERDLLLREGKEYRRILRSWGVEDPDLFWKKFDEYDIKGRKVLYEEGKLFLYPDVLDFLDYFSQKNVKFGLVTNTPRFIADYILSLFKISSFFNSVLGLGNIQDLAKPEPDGLLMSIELLNASPLNCFYFGDSLVDLVAAVRAKIPFIRVDHKKHFLSSKKHALILFLKPELIDRIRNNRVSKEDLKMLVDDCDTLLVFNESHFLVPSSLVHPSTGKFNFSLLKQYGKEHFILVIPSFLVNILEDYFSLLRT